MTTQATIPGFTTVPPPYRAPHDPARVPELVEALKKVAPLHELTESEFAPWTIVEATSKWQTRKKIFETIIAALDKRLGANAPPRVEVAGAAAKDAELRDAMESLGGGGL